MRIVQPVMSLDDALKVALAGRMDLQSLRDKFKDNERAVKLAADGLKPQLDLTASAGINSREARAGFPLPDVERYHWSAGLELDPALDRKEQRNAYRSAMIRCEQARRAVIQSEEDIKLAVREDWRGLEEARRNYEISEIGVRLSERRVREQDLLAEMGRGRAQGPGRRPKRFNQRAQPAHRRHGGSHDRPAAVLGASGDTIHQARRGLGGAFECPKCPLALTRSSACRCG